MAKPHFFISRAGEDAEYAKWVAAIHLAMARLHHSHDHFLKAEALIAATGYHRRDAELEALR